MSRPSWNEYFMQIAHLVSQRSTCIRRQVGVIIVKDKRVLSTGYNGAPTGLRHCLDLGCLRDQLQVPSGERHELCRGLHGEQNAIIQAALYGVSIEGGCIYSTHLPCSLCAKMLINAGVREIYYADGYPDELSSQLMDEAGMSVQKVSI